MVIVKTSNKKPARTSNRDPFEHHLEIKVREGTSEAEVAAIVNALATISGFFGVKLVKGGGGSGGKSSQRFRPMKVPPRPFRPKGIRPNIKIPPTPIPRPEYRVGAPQ